MEIELFVYLVDEVLINGCKRNDGSSGFFKSVHM